MCKQMNSQVSCGEILRKYVSRNISGKQMKQFVYFRKAGEEWGGRRQGCCREWEINSMQVLRYIKALSNISRSALKKTLKNPSFLIKRD